MTSKYKDKAFVIPVFIYTDRNLVEQRLKLDGYTQEKIDYRLERSESCWQDYLENDYLEIPIIINNSSKADFHRKIKQLFESKLVKEKYNYLYINPSLKYELISPLYGYKAIMQSKLEKFPFEKNVFLMMKFRNENMNTLKRTSNKEDSIVSGQMIKIGLILQIPLLILWQYCIVANTELLCLMKQKKMLPIIQMLHMNLE